MSKRRDFLKTLGLGSSIVGLGLSQCKEKESSSKLSNGPVFISTWNNAKANQTAWSSLNSGKSLLDSIESGIHIPENDPNDTSVGYGGRPDRSGVVTLDACIMDPEGNAGSVTYMSGFKNPISVARKVMENTPHVILSGDGAESFALENGFKKAELLTKDSEIAWKEWLKKSEYAPKINAERHDTIGMLGMNSDGDMAGGCSTSGLAFKRRGRVGDSPIIGAGLFVDNQIGAATATGLGELVLKTLASFLVVELMRNGQSPQLACKNAIKRITSNYNVENSQVGLIAINKNGEVGAFSIQKGFQYVVNRSQETELFDADFLLS